MVRQLQNLPKIASKPSPNLLKNFARSAFNVFRAALGNFGLRPGPGRPGRGRPGRGPGRRQKFPLRTKIGGPPGTTPSPKLRRRAVRRKKTKNWVAGRYVETKVWPAKTSRNIQNTRINSDGTRPKLGMGYANQCAQICPTSS